ncbi:MAG: hypothetical protein KDB07_08060, partial [Planctomycetes bacterium]|nr:hypothetical protein [Planctomycetota bacterium]
MRTIIGMMLLAIALAGPALAREELVTLPARDKVSLTIYNSVDLTLVSEERKIAFKQGNNRLSFSWAGTRIDPSSVEFRALKGGEKLEVLDTTFPGQARNMLVWKIDCEEAGDYEVEISYFTSGITWGAEYTGILAEDEASMTMTSYLTVTNHSGEDYNNAKVRVVIGTINLVQTLQELTKDEDDEGERSRRQMEELRKWARDAAPAENASKGAADKKAIV